MLIIHKVFDQNMFHIVTENQWWFILFLAGLILFKVIATSITFGAGGVGGVFAPTLFLVVLQVLFLLCFLTH